MRPNAHATAEVMARILRATSSFAFIDGLNPAQWSALRYFAGAQHSARSVVAFARYHGTTKGTASQTIAALEKKGLLERHRSVEDRRTVNLLLTDAGRVTLERDPLNELAAAIASLTDQQNVVMADGLETLLRTLLANRHEQRFRQREEAD